MTLTRLDPSAPETQVIKFGYVPTADANPVKGGQIKTEIFVALPDELKQRCKGAADPRTALYQPSETMTHDLVAKTSWPGLARPSRSARAAIDGRPVTRP